MASLQQGSLISPFPVSPSGGKPGRAGSPHAAGHAARQQKALAPIDAAAPPTRGVQSAPLNPPCASPRWAARARVQMVASIRGDQAGEKMKDGRHVGLDFYDLLIEAL